MNYFNWQKIHKQATTRQVKLNYSVPPQALYDPTLFMEIIHIRAWAELNSFCLREELEKLQKLAQQYDNGERLPDTFYLTQLGGIKQDGNS